MPTTRRRRPQPRRPQPKVAPTHIQRHTTATPQQKHKPPASGSGSGGGSAQPSPTMSMVATAYGPPWDSMNGTGVTAGGTNLKDGKPHYIIAVPPGSPLKQGSHYFVHPNPVGCSGTCTFLVDDVCPGCAADQIDIYDWKGRASQYAWGKRPVKVTPGVGAPGGVAPKTMADAVKNAAGSIVPDPLKVIADGIMRLFQASFWIRAGKAIVGLIALIIGIVIIGRAILGVDLGSIATKSIGALGSITGMKGGDTEKPSAADLAGEREYAKVAARERAKREGEQARRTQFFRNVNENNPSGDVPF